MESELRVSHGIAEAPETDSDCGTSGGASNKAGEGLAWSERKTKEGDIWNEGERARERWGVGAP